MAQNINRYKADLRDFRFLLFEQFELDELLGKAPFEDWDRDNVEMILDEVYKWVTEVLGPINGPGDREGCHFDGTKVTAPKGYKEAWASLYEAGWRSLGKSPDHDGQGAPFALVALVDELQSGANPAFNMYPGLTDGVSEVITHCGTDAQKKKYLPSLCDGTWSGTMCLTEPQAGSDVGANKTRATPIGDGLYKIQGTKIFISAGDHDLTDNIIHLVLARTEDAPSGTKGLSLFMVPRDKLDGSGSNDVAVGSIEHKMGINGSSTCVLNFGENDDCVGELVGTEEQQGIKQMFRMMNIARIGVGIQGLATASAAYLSALEYAKERKQGPSIKAWKDPEAPKVAIINHPDVRRMLIDMKSRVEGIRALAVKLAIHTDHERMLAGKDDAKAAYHKGQVDLLVPLLKAYGSDQAFQVCATAIQTFGGAGYLKDHPVEQACRDSKIYSIYEGTNHIQALDLVGRKLGYKGGVNLQAYVKDVFNLRPGTPRASCAGAGGRGPGERGRDPQRQRHALPRLVPERQDGDGAAGGQPLPRDDGRDHRRLAVARAGVAGVRQARVAARGRRRPFVLRGQEVRRDLLRAERAAGRRPQGRAAGQGRSQRGRHPRRSAGDRLSYFAIASRAAFSGTASR